MNILDYVILGILAISMIVGFIKGFIKQLLTVGGIIVVALLTATVSPFVQNWLTGVIESDGTRAAVAMFGTVILLIAVYSVLAWLIGKLLKKIHIIKILDKILGGVMGIAVVYLVFAVIIGLFTMTGEGFLPTLKSLLGESIETSWFSTNIYSNNFFGKWVIEGIAEKLIQNFKPAEEAARVFGSGIRIWS
ncbi:MAG: CvpA family protein [Clostridiales bacterium]|nr:CvpA family protein [Clostridiales bacterium]